MSKKIDDSMVGELDELFHEFMMSIGHVSDDMIRVVNDHQLTLPQMIALDMLTQGSQTVSSLSDLLRLTPGAVSRLVDRLVSQDLVNREEKEDDRRRKTLRLTAKGRLVRDKLDRARSGSFAMVMSQLDPGLAAELRDVLRHVVAVLRPRAAGPNGTGPSDRRQLPSAPAPRKPER